MREPLEIIDISQPVSSATACFPGDVPFSREVTVCFQESKLLNLCAFTMSPHVGTHADAPVHIGGTLDQSPDAPSQQTQAFAPNYQQVVGAVPLSPYVGPAVVVAVSTGVAGLRWEDVRACLEPLQPFPKRILFKTATRIRADVFESAYAWLTPDLIEALAQRGVLLVGLDTPSVDPIDSKTLDTHHALLHAGMAWLENLDLTAPGIQALHADTRGAPPNFQPYFLIALPLKMMELEASPVRAILLKWE
jgi:arylformamidase